MLSIFFQTIIPQHFLSCFAGWIANSRKPIIKNNLIHWFIKKYSVDMSECLIQNPEQFNTFNDFFIRELDMRFRPISSGEHDIVSPADGTIAQIGRIHEQTLLQAKEHYFDLPALFGGDTSLAHQFTNGNYATLYLAPHNYHRVHMPFSGKLIRTIFIPGKLFSVNRMTSELIPNLYARNERLICLFDTSDGLMAVILVGALIVGSIQTVWMKNPTRHVDIHIDESSSGLEIKKGEELGLFKLGSTVMVLFENDKSQWLSSFSANDPIKVGQLLGSMIR